MTQIPQTSGETLLTSLFSDARSQNGWRDGDVTEEQLRAAYDIAKWGPTSMNTQPQRIVFLKSPDAKARVKPALTPGNVDKAMRAPVIAILAYDIAFYDHLPKLFPHKADASAMFAGKDAMIQATAFRNATLQGAYFMIALRAIGLDVGPMSGFDAAKVDAEFFADTSFRSNFLCGIGRGDPTKVMARLPRLAFDEACKIA